MPVRRAAGEERLVASNMLKGKGGAFAYGGLVVLIVMAVALSALSGYIDN